MVQPGVAQSQSVAHHLGYAAGEHLTRNLTAESLLMAVQSRRPSLGLIHHSDRGQPVLLQ